MQPSSERYVISWFGYDICDSDLFTESDFERWIQGLRELTASMGLRIERLGNMTDVIVGKEIGSVSLKEFYSFQQRWDHLNEQLGVRMSGVLWRMHPDGGRDELSTWECYQHGKITLGDSIGRPQRLAPMTDNKRAALAKLLAIQVTELEFGVATTNLLCNRSILTIRDILKIPSAELTKILGKRRSEEIECKLQQLGLSRDIPSLS